MRILILLFALAFAAPVDAQTDTVFVVQQPHRSPGGAGLLSGLLVGAGQAYNGEWEKGLGFIGTEVVLLVTHQRFWDACSEGEESYGSDCKTADALLVGAIGVWVFNIVDAVRSAKRLNAQAVSVAPTFGLDGRLGLAVMAAAP